MPETGDGTGTKISDLARESKKGEGRSWIPAIPLTLLAPLLVIIALIGVLVPNSIILNEASQSSTNYLSDKLLALLLADVKAKVQVSVTQLVTATNTLVDLPETISAMTTNRYSLHNETFIQKAFVMKEKYQLDLLDCVSGVWADGYNSSSTPSVTTVNLTAMMILKDPIKHVVDALGVLDYNGK
ncbi:hypothetical protein HK104_009366 [Borealophlyctis nickersoniae]|nr:hypothetical protein HK104_009366 [Borealophlyctis nickersoniae]